MKLLLLLLSLNAHAVTVHEIHQFKSTASPTRVDTSAYGDGDQVGGPFWIIPSARGFVSVDAIKVVDAAGQGAPLTVWLFDDLPTVSSSDNALLDVSAAEMKDKFVGKFSVAAGDYGVTSVGSTAYSVFSGNKLVLKNNSTVIWGLIQSDGAPTYTTPDDLTLEFLFRSY